MASPQIENGYTRIADEIMSALIAYRIPGEQMQCLLFLLRKTYGYNKKWDMISNSQFVEATGIKKPNVCRAIRGLIDKNMVIKKDNNYIPTYQFNKNYKSWKPLSKKITAKSVIKKDIPVLSKKIPTIDITTIDNKKKNIKKKKVFGELENVKLTEIEYDKLKVKFPGSFTDKIEALSFYIKSKGDKYKSHYATILNWARMEKKREEKQNTLQPKTYAQAQDLERRTIAKALLKDRDNEKHNKEGVGKTVALLPDG